ncbi:MAG: tetratricopeptide repeat protein [Planctomycetota bacterium]
MQANCRQQLSIASHLIDKGQYREAGDQLKIARRTAPDESLRTAVASITARLDAEGQKILQEADEIASGRRYSEAIKKYRELASTFKDLPTGMKAQRAVDELYANPEVKALIAEMAAEELNAAIARFLGLAEPTAAGSTGGQSPGQAAISTETAASPLRIEKIRVASIEKQETAIGMLRKLASSYDQTARGKEAAADLKVLDQDKNLIAGIQKVHDERKCKNIFNLGTAYLEAGLRDKALEQFRKIGKEYPGTELAHKAARKIQQLE